MALGDKSPVVMGKEKGAAGGVATLGADGILAEAQRPSAAEILTLNGKSVEEALKSAGLPTGGLEGQMLVKAGADSETPTKWGPWPSNPNLLINGDFRKPVNRNGKSEYAPAGVTIDKWNLEGFGKLELVSDGIVLESTATYLRITQSPKRFTDLIGKLATFSFIYDNILYSVSFHLGDNNGSGHTVIGGVRIYSLGTDLPFAIQISGILRTGVISAVKLELGDQQTLAHKDADGNWVPNDPPDYDLQYVLCNQYSPSTGEFVGSQHSNPNLLDNAYWADKVAIINQRGLNEYTNAGYTIDRWIQEGRLRAQIIDDYIRITKTELAYNPSFYQLLENSNILSNKIVTVSFLYRTNITVRLTVNPNQSSQTPSTDIPTSDDWNLFSYSFIVTGQTNNVFWFQFRNTITEENNYFDLRAVKLELGPVQTLAHKEGDTWVLNDPPPNKALELAKCQRYQIKLGGLWRSARVDTNGFQFSIPIPTSLRAKPILVGTYGIIKTNQLGYIDGFSYDIQIANNAINISAVKPAHGLTDVVFYCQDVFADANI